MDFKGFKTYYRTAGECVEGKKPLVLLHGGPGCSHNDMEVLDRLAEEDGRMLVYYDQIGCGKSQAPGHKELFNFKTWIEELEALRAHLSLDNVHLLGHSAGGMILIEYACTAAPKGVQSYILSSTLPSSRLWGDEQHRLIKYLPKEMQDAIAEADRTGIYEGDAFAAAEEEFMDRHCGPDITEDSPECVKNNGWDSGLEAYMEAWGPNEFTPLGNMVDFDRTDELCHIETPVLLTSGGNDMSTPLLNKTMYDRLPHAEWELFPNARHTIYVEETDRYIEILKAWLNKND